MDDRATGDGRRATGDGRRATGDGRRATGDGRRATGDGRRATGDGRRATGDGRRATGDGPQRTVLVAVRSAVALHRLLDALPVFAGDARITRLFTLVPGSDFDVDALALIESVGGRTLPWEDALRGSYDLVLAASPKGELRLLAGQHVLLPHGAGFSKALAHEGAADSASGLDPAYLLADDESPVSLHALAHPDQVARLAAVSPRAAERAEVIGDPTLDRMLASRSLRASYRTALGTGSRELLVLASTWGPHSLLRRRPDLPAELAAHLPYDAYQLALIVHPNERSLLGSYDLSERLAPALDAGMVLAAPYEEWGAVLTAADALITDHGSAALYYAAVGGDRPIVSACRGGGELIPGSPMAELIASVPELGPAGTVRDALRAYRPGAADGPVRAAFAAREESLSRLREAVYALLALDPKPILPSPRPLPDPAPAARTPAVFDVQVRIDETRIKGTRVDGPRIDVERRPAGSEIPGHHLAAEHGAAAEQAVRSAGVLYRRPVTTSSALPHGTLWTAAGWTAHALDQYPGCRTAAAILPPERPASGAVRCVLRFRGADGTHTLRIAPRVEEDGRIALADPAAAVSAVHAWLLAHRDRPSASPHPQRLTCVIGGRPVDVHVSRSAAEEAAELV